MLYETKQNCQYVIHSGAVDSTHDNTDGKNAQGAAGALSRTKLTATNRRNPCPICSDIKGKCRTSGESFTLCMESREAPSGWKFIGETKDRLWGKFVLEDPNWKPIPKERTAVPEEKIIPEDRKHDAIELLTYQINISPRHYDDLRRRGLTDAEIGYLEPFLRSISTGYIVPFRDVWGKYTGIQIRRDNPDEGRYRWYEIQSGWSKKNKFQEMPLAVYRNGDPVWIVEGTGVKPAVSSFRHRVTTIGAAGGLHHSSSQTLAETIKTLGCTAVTIAPDAGDFATENPKRLNQLAQRMLSNIEAIQALGVMVRIAVWGQLTDKQVGDIDEIHNLDGVRYLTPSEFWALVPEFKPLVPEARGGGFLPKKQRHQKRDVIDAHAVLFSDEQRLEAYQSAIEEGFKIILDQSQTGSGKSLFDATLKPSMFGLKQLFYVCGSPYSPTVPELEKWALLAGKHGGLKNQLQPDGSFKLKRCEEGELPTVAANCVRHRAANVLRGANIDGKTASAVLCGTCPAYEQCAHAHDGVNFIGQRRRALGSERIRCNEESLPDPVEFEYSNTGVIFDDVLPRASRILHVSREDVALTLAELTAKGIQIDLTPLFSLLSGKTPRYGLQTAEILEQARVQASVEIAESIAPDLSKLLAPGALADHDVDLSDLPKEQRKFYAGDVLDGIKGLSKQWLGDYLTVCNGDAPGASLHIKNGILTITIPDPRFRKIVEANRVVIVQDATTTADDLAVRLGVDPSEIKVLRQEMGSDSNLRKIQVADLGAVTQNRGNDQERRINAIVGQVKTTGATAVIDFKKFGKDGAWWSTSRGSNAYQHMKNLILVGTPYSNLGAALSEYCAMRGELVTLEDSGFKEWYERKVTADILQAVGRLRALRRKDEQLTVYLLSDFPIEGFEQVEARSITPAAADKKTWLFEQVKAVGLDLLKQGVKATQGAISKVVGITQGRISQLVEEFGHSWDEFKKLLILLLEPCSEINNSSDGFVAETAPMLAEFIYVLPHSDVLGEFLHILRVYGLGMVCEILRIATPEQRKTWARIAAGLVD